MTGRALPPALCLPGDAGEGCNTLLVSLKGWWAPSRAICCQGGRTRCRVLRLGAAACGSGKHGTRWQGVHVGSCSAPAAGGAGAGRVRLKTRGVSAFWLPCSALAIYLPLRPGVRLLSGCGVPAQHSASKARCRGSGPPGACTGSGPLQCAEQSKGKGAARVWRCPLAGHSAS